MYNYLENCFRSETGKMNGLAPGSLVGYTGSSASFSPLQTCTSCILNSINVIAL